MNLDELNGRLYVLLKYKTFSWGKFAIWYLWYLWNILVTTKPSHRFDWPQKARSDPNKATSPEELMPYTFPEPMSRNHWKRLARVLPSFDRRMGFAEAGTIMSRVWNQDQAILLNYGYRLPENFLHFVGHFDRRGWSSSLDISCLRRSFSPRGFLKAGYMLE